MANTSARLAKVESVMIEQCGQAWERMSKATVAFVMWAFENGTPEQRAALDKWSTQQEMTDIERATFDAIPIPDAISKKAIQTLEAFDRYPEHIKKVIVARRETLSAQKAAEAETMADDLVQDEDEPEDAICT